MSGDGAISFELKNDLTEIATLAETLERFCACHGIAAEVTSVVNLALEEVVTNIISYTYGDGADRRIWIDLAVDGESLTALVQDDADALDPLAADEPGVAAPREEPRGLGIHLVRTLMDEVTYSREQGRNVLHLRKSTRR